MLSRKTAAIEWWFYQYPLKAKVKNYLCKAVTYSRFFIEKIKAQLKKSSTQLCRGYMLEKFLLLRHKFSLGAIGMPPVSKLVQEINFKLLFGNKKFGNLF